MTNGDSLLGHLSRQLSSQPENLATEALLFLLDRHDEAAAALLAVARRYEPYLAGPLAFRSQDWAATDGAIPDLVGVDGQGETPLVVEVKFWASLTPQQPCGYHERLPVDAPNLLLFLCPHERVHSLRAELENRCCHRAAGPDLEGALRLDHGRSMAVTSWRDLIDAIDQAMTQAGNDAGLSDLRQVRGLVALQDSTAFRPLEPDELAGRIGLRMGQYKTLIDSVVTALVNEGIAETAGLKGGQSAGVYFGRYFSLNGYQVLLMVHFEYWATERDTPLWLQLNDPLVPTLGAAIEPLRTTHPPRLLQKDGYPLMPLPLPAGESEQAVIEAVAARIRELAALLVADGN